MFPDEHFNRLLLRPILLRVSHGAENAGAELQSNSELKLYFWKVTLRDCRNYMAFRAAAGQTCEAIELVDFPCEVVPVVIFSRSVIVQNFQIFEMLRNHCSKPIYPPEKHVR